MKSHAQKLVLLALADNANDEGHCWPSLETLAKKSCVSRRWATNCIKSLQTQGHLTPKKREGRSTYYHLHPRTQFTPELSSPLNSAVVTPEVSSPPPPKSVPKPPKSVHPEPLEPSIRTIKEPLLIPAFISADDFFDFVAMRKDMKKPMNENAQRLAIRKLERWYHDGHDPNEILQNSTMNSYQGLFEPKEHKNGNKKNNIDNQLADMLERNRRGELTKGVGGDR